MTTLDSDLRIETKQADHTRREHLVWDWPVRFFHWSLVVSFVGAFVTNKLGVAYFKYHTAFGYAVVVLVAFRILWGAFGSKHARFINFVRGPQTILRYISELRSGALRRHAGHNPLGALMVVALLLMLGAQALFGLFSNDEIFNAGPLVGWIDKNTSLLLTSLHRKLFYVLAGAVLLHVLAVFLHVALKKESLVHAMVTGRKPAHEAPAHEAITSSRGVLAIVLLVVIAVGFAALLQFAPVSEASVADF